MGRVVLWHRGWNVFRHNWLTGGAAAVELPVHVAGSKKRSWSWKA